MSTGTTDTAAGTAASEVDPITEAASKGMLLAKYAASDPDRVAVVSPTGDRTFAELNARANQLIRALRRRGVAAGDAVALMCSNRPEFVEVVGACQRGGLRLTPINWHLTGGEAGYIIDDCEAKAIVADGRFADAVVAAMASAPNVPVRLAVGGDIKAFESYDDAVAEEDPADIDDPLLGGSMLYTSGTTGRPKGVHRPTPPLASSATLAVYGYRPDEDMHLCTGPLYHAAPLAFSLAIPLAAGTGVVLMDGWDPEETLRLIEQHRISHTHMVPTMFHRLLILPDEVKSRYDLSSLRFII
ncbi:MAG: long-chain acyl-CoA synthetase, partial [Acidimicrobiaceae bacterium]|nr:long-chain acyl-CoA synthetase [Acidimicrobiaceae bacterium]